MERPEEQFFTEAEAKPSLPTVSVVVCTRNNPDTLMRDAVATLHQSDPQEKDTTPWIETIVVDQSKDSITKERLHNSPISQSARFRYIPMSEKGLSRARNKAIEEATGDIIAFVDDDIKVGPGHVEKISALFKENPNMVMMFAPVHEDLETLEAAARDNWNATIPSHKVEKQYFITANDKRKKLGIGANMAIRKETAQKYLFDTKLGAGAEFPSYEEIDYSLRVLEGEKDKVIGVFEEPIVTHTGVRVGHEVAALMHGNARGHAAMKTKRARSNPSPRTIAKAFIPSKSIEKIIESTLRTGRPRGIKEIPVYFRAASESMRHPIDKTKGIYHDNNNT